MGALPKKHHFSAFSLKIGDSLVIKFHAEEMRFCLFCLQVMSLGVTMMMLFVPREGVTRR